MAVLISSPKDGDWTSVRSAIRKLASLKLGTDSTPTFAGLTLTDSFSLSYLTEGSVLFAGPGGLISQDNTNLSWDNATDTLTVANIIDNGLTASKGVYTDGSKQLTSTPPSSGALGYWSRAGTVISTATAGDDLTLTGVVKFDDDAGTIGSDTTNDLLTLGATGLSVNGGLVVDTDTLVVDAVNHWVNIISTTAPQFNLFYNATNFTAFAIGSDGSLTVTTVDSDGALGHIILNPDGKVFVYTELNMNANNIVDAGTIASGNITISSPTPILVFKDSNSLGAASVGFIEWRDSGGGRAGFLGNNSSGNDDLLWKNEQGGNIGIETTGTGEFQVEANTVLSGSVKMARLLAGEIT